MKRGRKSCPDFPPLVLGLRIYFYFEHVDGNGFVCAIHAIDKIW